MQVGESSLQQSKLMRRAGDIPGPAGTGAAVPDCFLHCHQHSWMLPHAEIVIGAPDRHVGAETMLQCTWERADAAIQFSEHSVPPLRRSEERRVGKECVSTYRSRGSPSH